MAQRIFIVSILLLVLLALLLAIPVGPTAHADPVPTAVCCDTGNLTQPYLYLPIVLKGQ